MATKLNQTASSTSITTAARVVMLAPQPLTKQLALPCPPQTRAMGRTSSASQIRA